MARTRLPYVQRRRRANGTIAFRGYDDSKPRNYSDTFNTEQEAYEAALRMRGEARNPAPGYTLDDGIEALKEELRLKRTPGTVRWYSDHLRAVCELIPGDTGLHDITRETVEEYVRDRLRAVEGRRRVKPQTVNADLRALHRVFALAIRRSIVHSNPVRQVDRPRADAPAIDWFRDDELAALLPRLPDQRTRDIVLLFAMTGLRRSEAARLEPGHVRLKLRQLVILGKTRTRVVPMSPDLDEPVKRLLAAAGTHLLPGGTHMLDELFRDAKRACGDRRLHMHALRHTFCSWLIRRRVPVHVLMKLADHRSIQTSMRYVHLVGDEVVDAVARLRLVQPRESGPAAEA